MTVKEEIKKVRDDIEYIERQIRGMKSHLKERKYRLETLLKITDNQISMVDTDGFEK